MTRSIISDEQPVKALGSRRTTAQTAAGGGRSCRTTKPREVMAAQLGREAAARSATPAFIRICRGCTKARSWLAGGRCAKTAHSDPISLQPYKPWDGRRLRRIHLPRCRTKESSCTSREPRVDLKAEVLVLLSRATIRRSSARYSRRRRLRRTREGKSAGCSGTDETTSSGPSATAPLRRARRP